MKGIFKVVTVGICLTMAFACIGCKEPQKEEGKVEKTEYTVTFVQAGYEDVTFTLAKGETISTLPKLQEKTGYTLRWERADFSDITSDITVNVIETANTYTITYETGLQSGVTIPSRSQEVTYDSNVTLYTPTHSEYNFVKWVIKGTDKEMKSGKYQTPNNVILEAKWAEKPGGDYGFID